MPLNKDRDGRVDELNKRFKDDKIPVRLNQRGQKLTLVATLPKKPEDGVGKKQYEISTGISANYQGFISADVEARKLGQLIQTNGFTWDKYRASQTCEKTIGEWVDSYKTQRLREGLSIASWKWFYWARYKKLPQNAALTASIIIAAVNCAESPWIKSEMIKQFEKLCIFAGLDIDLKHYKTKRVNSAKQKLKNRGKIPTEAEIIENYLKLKSNRWRWVYGMIAAFGMRPHEVFFCEWIDDTTLHIIDSKTGPRITYPVHPELVELWDLRNVVKPKLKHCKTFSAYGIQCNQRFYACDIDFSPYDLRHAAAIFMHLHDIPIKVASQMLGHTVEVHQKVYLSRLGTTEVKEVWERKLSKLVYSD